MKYRLDMVTNSSSSSFICCLCGAVESGWDLCLSEAGMLECENGHTMCESETFQPTQEDYKQYLIKYYNSCINSPYHEQYEIDDYKEELQNVLNDEDYDFEGQALDHEFRYEFPEKLCPICSFVEYLPSDLKKYLQKEYSVGEDEVLRENKIYMDSRRTGISELEYIFYVCKKFFLTPTEVVSTWKYKFKTYKEFSEYINSK